MSENEKREYQGPLLLIYHEIYAVFSRNREKIKVKK